MMLIPRDVFRSSPKMKVENSNTLFTLGIRPGVYPDVCTSVRPSSSSVFWQSAYLWFPIAWLCLRRTHPHRSMARKSFLHRLRVADCLVPHHVDRHDCSPRLVFDHGSHHARRRTSGWRFTRLRDQLLAGSAFFLTSYNVDDPVWALSKVLCGLGRPVHSSLPYISCAA